MAVMVRGQIPAGAPLPIRQFQLAIPFASDLEVKVLLGLLGPKFKMSIQSIEGAVAIVSSIFPPGWLIKLLWLLITLIGATVILTFTFADV